MRFAWFLFLFYPAGGGHLKTPFATLSIMKCATARITLCICFSSVFYSRVNKKIFVFDSGVELGLSALEKENIWKPLARFCQYLCNLIKLTCERPD